MFGLACWLTYGMASVTGSFSSVLSQLHSSTSRQPARPEGCRLTRDITNVVQSKYCTGMTCIINLKV
jgi:hypothetical protein